MKKEMINPLDVISSVLTRNGLGDGLNVGHIKYDKSINDDSNDVYCQSVTHDGTFAFVLDTIEKTILPFINKEIIQSKLDNNAKENIKDVEYILGDIVVKNEFKNGSQTICTQLPVKINYIYC